MKLLLSFLLLTALTWQALALAPPPDSCNPPPDSCNPPPSCPSNAAPCDQIARCVTDDPQYRHTYPCNWTVLMDSINYLELIDDRDGVWQRQDVDGTGTTWQQAGGICGHEVSVCETGTNRNNWFFTQYISYLDAREVIVNVTHDFTGCIDDPHFGGCQPDVTFHRYERDNINAAAARDPNNYSQLRVVTGTAGFGVNIGNTVFRFLRLSNSRGFYIGAQDTGSCASIRRLTLYYGNCPGKTEGVTVIPEIAVPPRGSTDRTTGVATCLPNAVPAPGTSLQIECDANGERISDPECVCSRGYEFVAATANCAAFCRACCNGTYQARDSNDFSCQPCPANSEARDQATPVCECEFDFNRPPGQPDEPCTRPPSSPRVAINNPPTVSGTSITVCWLPSLETGGRSDLHYNIYLLQNGGGGNAYQLAMTVNSNTNANPSTPLCRTLRNLTPGASYSVVVTAANGATDDPDSFTDVSVVQDRFIVFYFATGGEPSGTPDVNECNTDNGGCDHTCTNTPGSFQCSCDSGYTLDRDGSSCDDVNECTEGTHNCEQECTNTRGSFQCSCRSGYRLNSNRRSCNDINECTEGTHNCDQECTNTQGSFRCSCRSGYGLNGDGRNCRDINECTEGTHNCNQICTNTQGSFCCSCRNGYTLNSDGRTCDDVNECTDDDSDGCEQECTNTQGSFQCSCNSGYILNSDGRTCDDINECTEGTHNCNQLCTNTQGSFRCRCRSGYRLNGDSRTCDDINECTEGTHNCNQICTNTQGSFQCSCRSGYRLNSNRRTCDDINECTEGTHNCNQECTNTEGSFQCSCGSGYRLNDDGRTCDDINECNEGTHNCEQVCTNTQGSFQCSCRSGYRLASNRRSCVDINECTEGTHNCNQECTNTEGSFLCRCRSGYRLNSDGRTCIESGDEPDDDECISDNGGCDQICTNTQGSFECSCRSEYRLNSDGRTCNDIDECTEGTHNCNQVCTNTPGSFQCSCRSNYRLNSDGRTCDDIDECGTNNGGCDHTCTNIEGFFRCSCDSGFVLNSDGRTCDNMFLPTNDSIPGPGVAIDNDNPFTVDDTSITVCWQPSEDAESDVHYNIYLLQFGDGNNTYQRVMSNIDANPNTPLCRTIQNLTPESRYGVVITAANNATDDPDSFTDVSVVQDRSIMFFFETEAPPSLVNVGETGDSTDDGLSLGAGISITLILTLLVTAIVTAIIVLLIAWRLHKRSLSKYGTSNGAENNYSKPSIVAATTTTAFTDVTPPDPDWTDGTTNGTPVRAPSHQYTDIIIPDSGRPADPPTPHHYANITNGSSLASDSPKKPMPPPKPVFGHATNGSRSASDSPKKPMPPPKPVFGHATNGSGPKNLPPVRPKPPSRSPALGQYEMRNPTYEGGGY